MEEYDLRLKTPFSWLLAGGSGSGKTTKTLAFLNSHKLITDNPNCENIVYYYNQWQEQFDRVQPGTVSKWVQGLPTLEQITEDTSAHKKTGSIIVLDDFAHLMTKDIVELFTVYAHHGNCSVLLLTQNLFDKNPIFRQISLNCQYISIFKNPRDSLQISSFARQVNPTKPKFIVDCYRHATKKPYSYLFFDNHQKTDDRLRVRSRILPHEHPMWVYLEK